MCSVWSSLASLPSTSGWRAEEGQELKPGLEPRPDIGSALNYSHPVTAGRVPGSFLLPACLPSLHNQLHKSAILFFFPQIIDTHTTH